MHKVERRGKEPDGQSPAGMGSLTPVQGHLMCPEPASARETRPPHHDQDSPRAEPPLLDVSLLINQLLFQPLFLLALHLHGSLLGTRLPCCWSLDQVTLL